MNYATADLHFGHDHIIELVNRPFRNSTIMDKVLIQNINDTVGDDDDLYILGDVSLKTAQYRGYWENCINKIRCRCHLICGNHEAGLRVNFLAGDVGVGFFSVHYPYLMVDGFVCVHDPALSIVYRGLPFLCGHIHDTWVQMKNALNVGVDVWDYKPISFDFIKNFMKTEWEWFKEAYE